MTISKCFLILFLFFISDIPWACAGAGPEVVIDISRDGGVRYGFNGRMVNFSEVYNFASAQNHEFGSSAEYRVVFSADIPLKHVIGVKKTLQAIGFKEIRFFVFDSDRRYKLEIKFDKISPYVE